MAKSKRNGSKLFHDAITRDAIKAGIFNEDGSVNMPAEPVEQATTCPDHPWSSGANVECPGCVAVIRERNLAKRNMPETIDFTPVGLQTPEGVQRVNLTVRGVEEATAALACAATEFFDEWGATIAQQAPGLRDDIHQLQALIGARGRKQEAFLRAVAGAPPAPEPMPVKKNDCDGNGPHAPGEVRLLPTGGDSNLILCRWCWQRELEYRRTRNQKLGDFAQFALPAWESGKVYTTGQNNFQ